MLWREGAWGPVPRGKGVEAETETASYEDTNEGPELDLGDILHHLSRLSVKDSSERTPWKAGWWEFQSWPQNLEGKTVPCRRPGKRHGLIELGVHRLSWPSPEPLGRESSVSRAAEMIDPTAQKVPQQDDVGPHPHFKGALCILACGPVDCTHV